MIKSGAESVYLKGNHTGLLFLHGFTASPYELKHFAEKIHKIEGYTVSVPLLAGHGQDNDKLNSTRFEEFIRSANDAYDQIRTDCKYIFLIGMSMGGSLSLNIAASKKIDGLVLMGTPLYLPKKTVLLPFVLLFMKFLNKSGGPDIKDASVANSIVGNEKIPLHGLYQFKKMLKHIRAKLRLVKCPTLLFHSIDDHTIAFNNAKLIMSQIASADKELIELRNSYHIVSLDFDRDLVFENINKFIKRIQTKE